MLRWSYSRKFREKYGIHVVPSMWQMSINSRRDFMFKYSIIFTMLIFLLLCSACSMKTLIADQNEELFDEDALATVPPELRDEVKGLEQVMRHFSKLVHNNIVPCSDKKDGVVKYDVYMFKNSNNEPLENDIIKNFRECKHKYYVDALTKTGRNLRYFFGLSCNICTKVTLLTIHEKNDDKWKKVTCEEIMGTVLFN